MNQRIEILYNELCLFIILGLLEKYNFIKLFHAKFLELV